MLTKSVTPGVLQGHTCRLRGINTDFLNPAMYIEKKIHDNTTIDESTKGLLAQQNKSSILLAYNYM